MQASYTRIRTRMHARMHTHTHTHTNTHNTRTHTHTHARMHTRTHTCTHTRTHTHTHRHTHTHTQTHTHMHTHTQNTLLRVKWRCMVHSPQLPFPLKIWFSVQLWVWQSGGWCGLSTAGIRVRQWEVRKHILTPARAPNTLHGHVFRCTLVPVAAEESTLRRTWANLLLCVLWHSGCMLRTVSAE